MADFFADWAATIGPDDVAAGLVPAIQKWSPYRFDADTYDYPATVFQQPGVNHVYTLSMPYPEPLTQQFLTESFVAVYLTPDLEYRVSTYHLRYGGVVASDVGRDPVRVAAGDVVFKAYENRNFPDVQFYLYFAETQIILVGLQNFGLNTPQRDDWKIRFETIGYSRRP